MKIKTINLAFVFLTVLAIGWIIYLAKGYRVDTAVPEGYTLVDNDAWDSIKRIASLPPDTVVVDSFIYHTKIKYIDRPMPEPDITAPEIRIYADSIISDSTRIWWQAITKGTLEDMSITSSMVVKEKTIYVNKPAPYPVLHEVPVQVENLYISGKFGGGFHAGKFAAGLDLDYAAQNRIFGVQYIRAGGDNYYLVKAGIKIFSR